MSVITNREVAPTGNTNQATIAAATATRVATANTNRAVFTLRNIGGSNDMHFAEDSSVSASTGFLLRAASYDSYDIKHLGEVWVYSTSGTTVCYHEETQ